MRSTDTEVAVSYGRFLLSIGTTGELTNIFEIDLHGEIAGHGSGWIVFDSGTHDHSPAVCLELHDEEPPPDADAEASWLSSFTRERGDVLEILDDSYVPRHDAPVLHLPQGGPHEIRVTVRGREAARALGEGSFAHGVERWRIQIWPRRLAGPR
ncbi:hypothetical protein [Tenggerimyces flavus]|uniref:Uncharacterized protein n=1 Tax=Tenggerimyces flavus TaxID=1708749 RepID=A0ABV7Y233_9ACTN|nr:hypothetical protein [Tenggerimyces flavus]MBM7790915.1 hypothetical protein [Tenggerimyces flavus]